MLTWKLVTIGFALATLVGVVWLIVKYYQVVGLLRELDWNVYEIEVKTRERQKTCPETRLDPSGGG